MSEDPTDDEPFPANLETDTGTASAGAQLSPVDVRFGVHEGFDRVVIDLTGTGTPGWTVEYTEDSTAQGSGHPVDVAGDAVLAVRVAGVVMPTEEGADPWQGPQRLAPQTAGIVEEVVHGTLFEGVQTLYIGRQSQEPFRAFSLQDPTRVVIDVYHPDVTGGDAPLPDQDPAGDAMPFPANLQPDTNEVSAGAQLSPVDLRLGVHEGFDRVVLDLAGEGEPGWSAEYVDDPTLQGSGAPVELAGDAALKVVVRGVLYPVEEGAKEYRGPQRMDPEATGVVEEVVYGSIFEGHAEIFVGLASQEPFRVFPGGPHPRGHRRRPPMTTGSTRATRRGVRGGGRRRFPPGRSAASRRTVGGPRPGPISPAVGTEEDDVTESPATPPDGPHPQGTGIRDDAPTLSGLPDNAPDELRATLAGGDTGHIPTDAERAAQPDR